jgi:malonyl-ACP decarboxylase
VTTPRSVGTVVTGLGAVTPLGGTVPALTVALRAGRSAVARLQGAPEGACQFAAELAGFDLTAAMASAGVPADLAAAARRAAGRSPLPVQAALLAALEAWQDAALHERPRPPARLGLVVAGHNLNGRYVQQQAAHLASPALAPPRFSLHCQDTDHVGTLSQVLGIRGEGYSLGAASASGNAAIISASRLIECGAVDACLVVGALAELSDMERQALVNLGAMASCPHRSVPFDVAHAGFAPGHAAACLVLESVPSARDRGVPVLACLAGYALKLDGNALPDPSRDGECEVMHRAMREADLGPGDIDYISTHGTGSPQGDETELAAIREVLGRFFVRPWVNATKDLTGHCLSAAGVVEAVATVVQMRHGFVHPNPHLRDPIDDRIRFAGRQAAEVQITTALSNSFGFGGFNTSIVLSTSF